MSEKSYLRAAHIFNYKKYEQTNAAGVQQPVQNFSNRVSVPEFGIRIGVNNPKWRSQVERRENASTDFSGSKTTIQVKPMLYSLKYKVTQANSKVSFVATGKVAPTSVPSAPPPLSVFEADNRARQKFFKNAVKAQRFMQSGVFIGELRETLGMLRNPAKGLRNLVDVLTKDAKSAYKLPKGSKNKLTAAQRANAVKNAIADSWLEFSFGWRPLAGDLDAASQLLANLALRVNDNFVRVEGVGEENVIASVSDTLISADMAPSALRPFALREQQQTSRNVLVRYYGMIRLDLPTQTNSRLMTALGLTLNDIAPTAWELIPWSFFVDYFTNIGDMIEAWSYPKAKIAWVTRVERRITNRSTFWTYNDSRTREQYAGNSYIPTSFKVKDGHYISRTKEVLRTASVDLRPPSLTFELPFSSRKFLNIGALIANMGRRQR